MAVPADAIKDILLAKHKVKPSVEFLRPIEKNKAQTRPECYSSTPCMLVAQVSPF